MARKKTQSEAETEMPSEPVLSEQRSRIEAVRREVDRLFDAINPTDWRLPVIGSGGVEVRQPRRPDWQVAPAVNFKETDTGYVVSAELAGMTEADVEVKIANGVLTMKGEKRDEHEESEPEYHLSERRFGRFQRSFRVPEGVDEDTITAKMSHGMLTITLPKTREAREKEKKIKVAKA
ncbi:MULTISPECIES: Hsp20/alpha crystallin family protein [unclassified Roseitalea]|uniref:Hsp20/alpha crystallin family protein n=1 Tax=unclassified Roseitalea TaxID=2639107 RepID=UPI00273D7AEB|nr:MULTISPECIES: Hsp20/alpha crystallin family protein [unclassified Roseitalea]